MSRQALGAELVQPVYDQLTERFDTTDLRTTKAVLDTLH